MEKTYGFMGKKTMILFRKLWNLDLVRREITWQTTKKHRKFDFVMEKTMVIYTETIEVFKQIYSFRTLIYYEKTTVLRKKNFGSIEKKNNDSRKLWNFDLLWNKLWCYGKNYDTLVNYS